MTPREAIRMGASVLKSAGVPDPIEDASWLLSSIVHRPPLSLRLDTDVQLSEKDLSHYQLLCGQRATRIPLQYLTHEQSFLGHSFYVDERVLIPRPETELLVEYAIHRLQAMDRPAVLDLCCGSGCIGISIALSCPNAVVTAADLSKDALDVAQINARLLHADIQLVHTDLFGHLSGTWDCIVSNPPYIPDEECLSLQEEVRMEPFMALQGGNDGLLFYRRIAAEAPAHMHEGSILMLELGIHEADSVSSILSSAGFAILSIDQDYSGIPRILTAKYTRRLHA